MTSPNPLTIHHPPQDIPVVEPKETDMSVPQPQENTPSASGMRRRYRRKTNVQRVLDALKDGNARDIDAIAKQAGLTRQQVHGAAWLLCKEETITRIGHGTYILTKALNTWVSEEAEEESTEEDKKEEETTEEETSSEDEEAAPV